MEIKVTNICKQYGKRQVLSNLSFSAVSGECVGIFGENGSGKSTLFSVLTGLQKGSGSFYIDKEDMFAQAKKRADTVGFVPQNPPLFQELTAFDNLSLWYSSGEMKKELQNGRLKMLGINEFLKVKVSKMSGGMKKRLAIGCAIAKKQPVMLLDEPTSALDMIGKETIYKYLQSYTESGGIVVLATHAAEELKLCNRVLLLKNGRLIPYTGDLISEQLIESLKNA